MNIPRAPLTSLCKVAMGLLWADSIPYDDKKVLAALLSRMKKIIWPYHDVKFLFNSYDLFSDKDWEYCVFCFCILCINMLFFNFLDKAYVLNPHYRFVSSFIDVKCDDGWNLTVYVTVVTGSGEKYRLADLNMEATASGDDEDDDIDWEEG